MAKIIPAADDFWNFVGRPPAGAPSVCTQAAYRLKSQNNQALVLIVKTRLLLTFPPLTVSAVFGGCEVGKLIFAFYLMNSRGRIISELPLASLNLALSGDFPKIQKKSNDERSN